MLTVNKLGAFTVLLADTLKRACGALSPSAAALLLTLYYSRSATATTLGKVAGISQPTAVRVLDGLIRQGFVKRQVRTGRATFMRLTPLGRKSARLLQNARLIAMSDVLNVLRPKEQAIFERVLDRILADATTSPALARTICRLCDHSVCHGPRCPIGTRARKIEQGVDI
jgi:DNA-binding MarR family transcriptional regulator